PVGHCAALVLYVDIKPGVRIGPLDFGHHAMQRHRFAGVVLGYERMMRKRRERRGQQADAGNQQAQLSSHGSPPSGQIKTVAQCELLRNIHFLTLRADSCTRLLRFPESVVNHFALGEVSAGGEAVNDTCYPWARAMSAMRIFWRSGCALIFAGVLFSALYAQRPFREYPSVEYGESIRLPPDWQHQGEWTFARLMYPPGPLDGYRGRFDGDWRLGLSLWTQDYPRADRAFSQAVRRLTRVDTRSVEQSVNLDDGDEVYHWPWLYAVQVGEWGPTDRQMLKLRDYLLRGGFFM